MRDRLHDFWDWVDYNRDSVTAVAGLIVLLVLCLVAYGPGSAPAEAHRCPSEVSNAPLADVSRFDAYEIPVGTILSAPGKARSDTLKRPAVLLYPRLGLEQQERSAS